MDKQRRDLREAIFHAEKRDKLTRERDSDQSHSKADIYRRQEYQEKQRTQNGPRRT